MGFAWDGPERSDLDQLRFAHSFKEVVIVYYGSITLLLLAVLLTAPIATEAQAPKTAEDASEATVEALRTRGHALAAEIEDALARLAENRNGRIQDARGDVRGSDRMPTRLGAAKARADLHEAREKLESLREEARRAGAPAALLRELEDMEPAPGPTEGNSGGSAAVEELEARARDYRARAERNRTQVDSCSRGDDEQAASCKERYQQRAKDEDAIAEQYERLAEEARRDSEI